jgi:hypothetical protein
LLLLKPGRGTRGWLLLAYNNDGVVRALRRAKGDEKGLSSSIEGYLVDDKGELDKLCVVATFVLRFESSSLTDSDGVVERIDALRLCCVGIAGNAGAAGLQGINRIRKHHSEDNERFSSLAISANIW